MSSNHTNDDQAQNLRKIVEAEQNFGSENTDDYNVETLPPRKEVHSAKDKKKRTKIRLEYPLIRLLVIVFLLLIFLIPGYSYWKDRTLPVNQGDRIDQPNTNRHVELIQINDHARNNIDEKKKKLTEPSQNQSGVIINEANRDLKAPSKAVTTKEQPVNDKTEGNYKIHVVQPGETLYRISQIYFNSREGEELILKANGLTTRDINSIKSGTKLKIPISK